MGKFFRQITVATLVLFSATVLAKQSASECERFLSEAVSPLNRLISYSPLPSPHVSSKSERDGLTYEKVELAEIVAVDNPQIQEIIDYVRARGGQIRLLKSRVTIEGFKKPPVWQDESPYFWVDPREESPSYLIPVIGIDLTSVGALSALAHEFEHFKVWWEEFESALHKGFDRKAAAHFAIDKVWEPKMVVYGESLAVAAEMKLEREWPHHPFNRLEWRHSSHPWQRDYVNRITYPEFEGVRILLKKVQAAVKSGDSKMDELNEYTGLLDMYVHQMVYVANETRENALKTLAPDHELVAYWKSQTLIQLLIEPFGSESLKRDGLFEAFTALVRYKCLEHSHDTDFCK